MMTNAHRLLRFIATIALLCCPITSGASAYDPPWTGDSFLDDPEWRNRFIGSYGFLSAAEPEIDATELEVLRDVLDLMKLNPRAAAATLAQRTTPESSAALDFILANLQFQNDDAPSAIASYQRALHKFPDFRRAHKNLGLLFVQQNDCAASVRHLSKAVENGDRDGRTFGLLGYCYLQLEDPLAAESAYRVAALQQPEIRDWKLGFARALLGLERFGDAAALFETLIAQNPEDSNIWLLQANAYLGLEQPMKAAVNLETVRMLGKAMPSSLVLLGDIYLNARMPDLAASAYREVIESPQFDTEFRTAIRAANLLFQTQSSQDAESVVASIDRRYGAKLKGSEELQLLTLKAKLARSEGRESEAAKLLTSIVERDGTRGDALLELADHYQKGGELERAALLIDRAEGLKDFEREALLASAKLLVAARDYTTAARQLRRALQIQAEPRVERYLARVEQAIRP